jgi:hypothetical protein
MVIQALSLTGCKVVISTSCDDARTVTPRIATRTYTVVLPY